jgi:hypothetical protein
MRWRTEFYHERQGILARYGLEAPTAAAAVELGWAAVRAEHPRPPSRRTRRPSLFERAERAGGQDASGWVLYRIRNEGGGADRAAAAGREEAGAPAAPSGA